MLRSHNAHWRVNLQVILDTRFFQRPEHQLGAQDILSRQHGLGRRLDTLEESQCFPQICLNNGFIIMNYLCASWVWNRLCKCVCVCVFLPIQHSSLAQGDVLTTSGGSTPTLRHNTRATLTVFIWGGDREVNTHASEHTLYWDYFSYKHMHSYTEWRETLIIYITWVKDVHIS